MLHSVPYQQLVVAQCKMFVVDDFFIWMASQKFADEQRKNRKRKMEENEYNLSGGGRRMKKIDKKMLLDSLFKFQT